MRASLIVSLVLAVAALARAGAQCPPATQKLITDLKYDEARVQADAAIKRNGSDDAALHCMGMIYIAMDDSKAAIEWFEKAVKANDASSIHHLWLANSLGEQASHTSKLKLPFLARRIKGEFDRAAQLDPSSIEARHGLIQFYSQAPGVMGGSMDKAKEQAREIGKLNAMRGHFEMATLLSREKDTSGVERELEAAVAAASPDSIIGSLTLANYYGNQKRWADAFAIYDRIIKEHPADVNGHFQYGRAAAISGENMERGATELRHYLANAPKDAPIVTVAGAHWRLGMIAEKEGKKDVARSEYQTAVSINPRNLDAKKALDALK
jgi:tetratricopeptide (TPR) repeat protein